MTTERQPSFVFVPCGGIYTGQLEYSAPAAKMHLFFMAFPTIRLVFGRKNLASVVTDATGLTFDHVIHSSFADNTFTGKSLNMTILATRRPSMEMNS